MTPHLRKALAGLLHWSAFPQAVQVPLVVVTAALIGYAFLSWRRGESNLTNTMVWQVWWLLLPFTTIVAGRFWCGVCPFPALGDWVQARRRTQLPYPPKWLRRQGIWVGVGAFLMLAMAFPVYRLKSDASATGWLLVGFGFFAVALALVFRGRAWCRYLCPVGILVGVNSLLSAAWLRPKEGQRHDPQGRLVKLCPVYESPPNLRTTRNCHLCAACLQAEGGARMEVAVEAPWPRLQAGRGVSLADGATIQLLWGFVLVDTARMTPWYPTYMASALPWFGNDFKLATAALIIASIAAVLLLWGSAALGLRRWFRWRLALIIPSILVLPLALGGQLALSAQHLWGSLPMAANVLAAELGFTTVSHLHLPPSEAYFVSLPLKLLQFAMLAVAVAATIRLARSQMPRPALVRGAAAVAVPSMLLFYLFGQPMSGSC